ncbi:MAG: phytanoyl-CoA dioxygenase family protein [Verrucomicrobiota bacterium]
MPHSVSQDGFAIVPEVLTPAECSQFISLLGTMKTAGSRGLLGLHEIRDLAFSKTILHFLRPHMSTEPFPVRGIYFDKSAETNWLVTWHQDLTITVKQRHESSGFGPWSVKDGMPHVQPPISILQGMLTIRLHLDDADETNGALRVIPGSHRFGRLSSDEIQRIAQGRAAVTCSAPQGAALLMRPLILHASSRSTSERHRRVIHLEYACDSLPEGLEWQAVPDHASE